jgi:hypothetical protein
MSIKQDKIIQEVRMTNMTKRFFSIAAAIVFMLSLTAAVFAAPAPTTVTTFNDMVSISNVTKTGDINTDKSFDMAKTDKMLELSDEHRPGESVRYELYYGTSPMKITINESDEDEYGISSYACYYPDGTGKPEFDLSKYVYMIYYPDNEEYVGVEAFSGSVTLTKAGTYYLYLTNFSSISTDYDVGIYIVVGNDTASAPAVSTVNAVPTASTVLVNGKPTSFQAYNINGNNYFKLRDLAKAVDGTEKSFEVTWDGAKKAINLISNSRYTTVGGELAKGDGKAKTASLSTATIYKDGVEAALTAYTINGNNYFKLRDVAQAFNIGVTWDAATKTVGIDTTADYVP